MARFAWMYLGTAIVLLLLDAVWLWLMVGRVYQSRIGPLLRDGFDPVAAGAFYLLFVAGVVVFVGLPSWDADRWTPLWRGAFFGLVAYATYDLTNQATLRDWSWFVTGVDLVWGTVLTAIAGTAGVMFARMMMRG